MRPTENGERIILESPEDQGFARGILWRAGLISMTDSREEPLGEPILDNQTGVTVYELNRVQSLALAEGLVEYLERSHMSRFLPVVQAHRKAAVVTANPFAEANIGTLFIKEREHPSTSD
jgi:hypothetical protein